MGVIGRARMAHERPGRRHPLVEAAAVDLRAGRLDRREFLRFATLLGVSVAAARSIAGDPARAQGVATAAASENREPRFGGVLRCGMPIQPLVDPARFAWIEMSNQVRHQLEHLTITGPDNLTRPMLAAGWAASDDLKTWTFQLREGVRWGNGDAFSAEDVAFNMARWLDPETRSSNLGLFATMTEADPNAADSEVVAGGWARRAIEGALEVVDPLTVRLHLASPVLAMPENFYNYPTAILHRGYVGEPLWEALGTGPYRLVESAPGEFARLTRVAEQAYWGAEIPHIGPGYVDEIQYRHFDPGDPRVKEALNAGEIDLTYEIDLESPQAGPQGPEARLLTIDTAQAPCLRMRTDLAPFDDPRVRRAIQLCCDARAYPDALFDGRGRVGEHHHVAPIHPEYFPLPRQRRRVEEARELLAAAGYDDGLDLVLDVGNTSGPWQERCCRLLSEQAAEAGIRIEVNVISAAEYESTWRFRPFGLTQWVHRPLGTMALSLGYRSGVPWNETRYANPEFDAALTRAEALLDLAARRDAMEEVQRILQRDAVMVQPCWRPVAILASQRLRGLAPHPSLYHQFNNVWFADA
ncbi:MAG: ABC transporter substrate-binding protein [Pseudomonadota bacterium]